MAAAAAEAARKQRQRKLAIGVLGLLIVTSSVVGVAFLVGSTSDNDKPDKVATQGSTATTATTAPAAAGAKMPPAPKGRTLTGKTPCPPTSGQVSRVSQFAQAPPMCIDPAKAYTAKVDTSDGAFTIALDPKAAPVTVNNFVVLSRYGYFDGLPFHRIIPDFVVQGGASGIPDYGSGGPGYDLDKEEKPKGAYKAGDIAMARSEKVSGSQFFVVVGNGGSSLTPDYPRFGHVTSGLPGLEKLATTIGTSEGAPTKVVTIKKVTISEGQPQG